MNAILGFTELLDGLLTEPKQRSYLEAIQASGKTLLTLITDILDLSKLEAGKMILQVEPVRLRRLFEEIQQIFSLRLEQKRLAFTIEVEVSVPEVLMLDKARLRQVLFNLVGNAVKFTERGSITLAARLQAATEVDDAIDLLLRVEDTGIGISADEQQQIFDAFHQKTDREGQRFSGTGLGLTISQRLVRLMGGTINVRSKEGVGSVFEVRLPQVAVAAMDTLIPDVQTCIPDLSDLQATILVVDDVDSNRHLLTASFDDTALVVLEAQNGQEALRVARRQHPDVILMDLKMPVMNGYEARRQLQRDPALQSIPVIAITASSMQRKAELTRFAGFLRKPVSKALLFEEICRVLHYAPPTSGESPARATAAPPEELSAEALAALPDALTQLKQTFMPQWEQFQTIQPINEVTRFGSALRILGETAHLPLLTDYADTLLTAIHHFDIHTIRITLHKFPTVIEKLQSLGGKHE